MTSILLYAAIGFLCGFAASTLWALRNMRRLRAEVAALNAHNAAMVRQVRAMRLRCTEAKAVVERVKVQEEVQR